MKTANVIKIAFKALGSHKIRTALAITAVSVGVCAVILMMAIGKGAEDAILKKVQSLGTNLIVITAGKVRVVAGRPRQIGTVTSLKVRDSEAIAKEVSSVAYPAPFQGTKFIVKYGDTSAPSIVAGTTPDFTAIRNFRLTLGRFFSNDEVKAAARVAVLGRTVVKNVFGGADPIGETIRVKNVPFEVIGVLDEKGVNAMGQDDDDIILIPISTILRRLMNVSYISTIYTAAKDAAGMKTIVVELESVLRESHHLKEGAENDFGIQNQADILNSERETSTAFALLLMTIASVSLVIGGAGITAILSISIRVRIGEIGVRRAFGARSKDILCQFLMEATTLSITGGFLGMILGVASAFIAATTSGLPVAVSIPVLIEAFIFSSAIGIISGIYPAKKASSLNPIHALSLK